MRAAKENFLTLEKKEQLRREIYASIRGLDILEEILLEEDVTEIMINGAEHIFLEEKGKMHRWSGKFESRQKLEDIVQLIVARANRIVNEANPIVDARLADGSRVNVILPPVALNGPIVTIRKFSKEPFTMERLLEIGAITPEAAEFLQLLVEAKYNIFICGGTGSGKTTFLNALTAFIPGNERIITIEDAAELKVNGVENLVRLEVRNKNTEGTGEISIRELIRASLRMRPDRIIVGEVRGAETIDMLQAMNTGHDGSLSTGHGNSIPDMLDRLETMVLLGTDIPLSAARRQIASAIEIMVHLGRLRDGRRCVLEISEILGCRDGEIEKNPLFVFQENGEGTAGVLKRTGAVFVQQTKLKRAGKREWNFSEVEDEEKTPSFVAGV
ncbi:MAG: CpaF family protein [Lachnospiraceae bacterium]|nr:CpaF family protein [Lachnospiraceae bacterium]MBP3577914.1 CpaF family protein [Lachnospiraceae bacterium]